MKTLKELKDFCEKNNIRYEINPRYSDNGYYSCLDHEWKRIQIGWWFGMNNISGTKQGECQWVWFLSYEDNLEDANLFWFDQRYSMVTGQAHKGINESIRAINTIERRS